MTEPQRTVFIIDDDPAIRDSLATLVRVMQESAETFDSAEQFLENFVVPRPGCAVVDIRMPGMSGLELQRRLLDAARFLPVIIISGHGNIPISVEAMRHGAVDFLEKPYDPEQFKQSVRSALDESLVRWQQYQRQCAIDTRIARLTDREREVYDQLLAGKTVKELAFSLGISPSTAEKHRLKVYEKLEVDSVPELMKLVMGDGSIGTPDA